MWKFDNAGMSYANAEVVRKLLVSMLLGGAMVLFGHEHFGMDLAPGLSIKLNQALVSDIVGIKCLEDNTLKVVRQEFACIAHTQVSCDVASGAREL